MTLTIQEAYDVIMDLFTIGWLADPTSSSVPLIYDDRTGDPPGTAGDGTPLPFARVSVVPVDSIRQGIAQIGDRRFRETSIFTVQIFTPFGDGRTQSNALLQVAADILRAAPVGELEVAVVGPPERLGQDGPYFAVNMPAVLYYFQIG